MFHNTCTPSPPTPPFFSFLFNGGWGEDCFAFCDLIFVCEIRCPGRQFLFCCCFLIFKWAMGTGLLHILRFYLYCSGLYGGS